MRGFSILIILIIFSASFMGCITKRGTSVDTSNLIRLPNGTWKLKPLPKVTPELNIKPVPIEPIKLVPAKTKPIDPIKLVPAKTKPIASATASSVVAEIQPIKIEAAGGDLKPFTPTVSSERAESTKLLPLFPVVNVTKLTGEEVSGETGVVIPREATPKKDSLFTVNWIKLVLFYSLAALVLVMAYLVYMKKRATKPKPSSRKKRRSAKKSKKT